MPDTGELGFAPILHNITPDKVAICYRQGDADSLEVANYYCSQRRVPVDNRIALPCSTDNIISETEYLDTIQDPLIAALENIRNEPGSAAERQIWAIVLGYHIPHAYRVGADPYDPYNPYGLGELIAIASRIHRLEKTPDYKRPNHTYDRRGNFRYFDTTDSEELYITAVIDGPTKNIAKRLIERSLDVDNQTFVTGKIFVDPYGRKDTTAQIEFEEDIINFIDFESDYLGLELDQTVDIDDPYQQPIIKALHSDSFYWGRSNPRFAKELFLNQNQRRCFLYNADDIGAADISAPLDMEASNPWLNLAINVEPGYAGTAGTVDAPGEDAYLRPRPFFETLHRGAGLGEAFLYSSRYVDWKIVLVGDPLMVVNFPNSLPYTQDLSDDRIPNSEVIIRTKNSVEEGIAYAVRQRIILNQIVNTNVSSTNLSEKMPLLYALAKWRDLKDDSNQSDLYAQTINSFITYILSTSGLSLNEWLEANNERISILLNEAIKTSGSANVSSRLIFSEGYWQYDFVYFHSLLTLENIHFELEIATDAGFNNPVISLATRNSILGWKYESEIYSFSQLPSTGFPSNFAGRRTRYSSVEQDFLIRGNLYYVRWRALSSEGEPLTGYFVDPGQLIIKT